ncbi:MAG TPA: hydrogenase maturation nickel metallochaperone HypA [Thermoleophilaceae bacterium]
MHELSIAEAIVAVAERHAAGRSVYAVDVKVGRLRQVVPCALEFAFELTTKGTRLEGAALRIEDVPAGGRCRACGAESVFESFPLACGACGGLGVEITEGEELLVDSLELEETMTTTGGMRHGD